MSLRDAGQLPATPHTNLPVSPPGSTHDASPDATSRPDERSPAANWSQGTDTVIAVDTDQPATAAVAAAANTAAQKIAAPAAHWECPAPGTAGAAMIAAHGVVTGVYGVGSSLLIYFTVEATKACLATLNSDPSASSAHRTNAIACGIGAGAFVACSVAWGLTYLKSSIEQGMIRRHA